LIESAPLRGKFNGLKGLIEAIATLNAALVTLAWHSDFPQVGGIDQQAGVLGAAAVDLLVTQYQQNERGIPEAPKIVMTEGVWRAAQD